jgi:hypothetical protein
VTLAQARLLPGLAPCNAMTLRRHLEPARTGRWLKLGTHHWLVVYDEAMVRLVAHDLAAGQPNPLRARPPSPSQSPDPVRVKRTTVPAGLPGEAWATVAHIWLALRSLGFEADRVTVRDVRVRLLALNVVSERRAVTQRIERVFPLELALTVLRADPKFMRRINGLHWWSAASTALGCEGRRHD